MQRKTLFLLIPFFIIIVILFFGLLVFLDIPIYPFFVEICGCHHIIPNYFLLIFGFLLVIAVMHVSYHFSSKKMEEKLDKHVRVLSKFTGKNIDKGVNTSLVDTESFLKFLNTNERIILKKMLERKGSVYQSEISRMEHMTKLKAHRAVKSLVQRRIVRLERHGKTNKIFLTENAQNLLSSLD